jgi:hypothetical protein
MRLSLPDFARRAKACRIAGGFPMVEKSLEVVGKGFLLDQIDLIIFRSIGYDVFN